MQAHCDTVHQQKKTLKIADIKNRLLAPIVQNNSNTFLSVIVGPFSTICQYIIL